MLGSTILVVALVSGLLIVVFKSVRFGLISLIPNFAPVAMSIGVWGYFVGNIGIASAVLVAIAFGIIVDDTIHFMTKYLRARREKGATPPQAVQFAFDSVGRALWTTTLVLAIGFLVFTLSGFQPSWALGSLVAITIVLALATDFLLLPPLLMAVDRTKQG